METKELQAKLDELKSTLEANVSDSVKKETEAQIKALEAKIPDTKALETSVGEVKKTADEVKTSVEGIEKSVKTISEWQVQKDEADKKNQEVIDRISKQSQRQSDQSNGTKTLAQAIDEAMNEGDNYKNIEMMALNHKDRQKRFSFDLKTVADITTGNVDGSRFGSVFAPNIIEPNKRKVHVRSLVPIGAAGPGNTYTFMREEGDGEGAPAPTAETSEKPQFDMDLKEADVKFEWIAGWVRVSRKAMNNIPGFLSYLNSRLPEKLLRAEDKQLLLGDGNTPNISGIMDSGNFTAASSAADVLVEAIIDGIAQLEDDEERDATGILIRPNAYYSFFKNKAEGSGEYDLPQNVTFVNGVLYISGVPVYSSTAMSKDASNVSMNKYIVGDWRMGAQLLIQNGMRIEFFEQDGTNVRENKITVRIEESIAFPIYGDNYFIVGDVPEEES